MNRIQKIVYTMACLLTATGAWAGDYTIRLNAPSNGTMESNVATANSGETVTLTVNPIDNYYLSALYYEKVVTDMGGAESRRRRSPGFSEKTIIPINTTVPSSHYGGTYNISMPPYDIEVTAIFTPCTSITGAKLHWDSSSSSTSITYDGSEHTANVYLDSSDLTVNADYTIDTNERTDVGSITPTITGVGTYCGTINNQTISITTKTLDIAAVEGQSKAYGDSDPTFTYTHTGLCSGDQISGALSRTEGENAGTYAINIGTLTAGSNYNIAFTSKNFTINPKDLSAVALTISLDHDYFNYNGEVQKAEITGITYGNTTLNSGSDYNSTFTYGTGKYGFADNTTPDIYTISVSFIGNYTGTATKEYQVRPKITMSGNNVWYTYFNPTYNMKMPDEVKAYTISGNTQTQISLSPNNESGHGYIKAATPMLLYYSGASTDIYPELVKTDDTHLSGISSYTYYHGLSFATDVTSLTEYSTQDIWILVNNQFVRTASGNIPANRCYLALDKSSITVPHFAPAINFGGLTGIDEPRDKKENIEMKIYNLNGQRVQNPTKGLYIVNGKKVIIK